WRGVLEVGDVHQLAVEKVIPLGRAQRSTEAVHRASHLSLLDGLAELRRSGQRREAQHHADPRWWRALRDAGVAAKPSLGPHAHPRLDDAEMVDGVSRLLTLENGPSLLQRTRTD